MSTTTYRATVKDAPKLIKFNDGQKLVVRCTDDRGNDVDVWGKPNNNHLSALWVGQEVTIQQQGRKKTIISPAPGAAVPTPTINPAYAGNGPKPTRQQKQIANPWENLNKKDKQTIIGYIENNAKMYKHCLDTVASELQDYNFNDENIRGIATTIYLSTTRKFNL